MNYQSHVLSQTKTYDYTIPLKTHVIVSHIVYNHK